MEISFYIDGKKINSMDLPKDSPLFNVGDQLDLISHTEQKYIVTKRTYIAYFSGAKTDEDLGKPNAYGWKLDVSKESEL